MAQYILAELSNAVSLLIGSPEQFTVGFVKVSVVVPSGIIFAFSRSMLTGRFLI